MSYFGSKPMERRRIDMSSIIIKKKVQSVDGML